MLLLGHEKATVCEVRDESGQQTRLAFYYDDLLIGVFFAAPTPVSLARSHIVSLVGTNVAPLQALAGRSGADQVDPGPTVCACMNVGLKLGAVTCAGTSCGSCKPELESLLAQIHLPMAAE